MMCSFAILDGRALDVVKGVENETGRTILAYDCFEAEAIDEEEVRKITEAEKKLCRTLVAVKTGHRAEPSEAERPSSPRSSPLCSGHSPALDMGRWDKDDKIDSS